MLCYKIKDLATYDQARSQNFAIGGLSLGYGGFAPDGGTKILHFLHFLGKNTGLAKKMLPLLIHTQILKMNIYSNFFFTDV